MRATNKLSGQIANKLALVIVTLLIEQAVYWLADFINAKLAIYGHFIKRI